MQQLFPEIEPNSAFYLPVGDGHSLYVEDVGNPEGVPVVFLHGGPGGGFGPAHRRLFDPAFYRIVLFDQRGAGKSKPHAELNANTTWALVDDIERIREHLGIDRWLVFGGSWGSTLGLAYAETYPECATGLILRGIFLCREEEIQWFYQRGCSWILPDLWEGFLLPIPEEERCEMVSAYYRRLTSQDEATRLSAAKAWSIWEGAACKLVPNPVTIEHFADSEHALAMARIECHFFINHCWFDTDNHLIENVDCIRHIPTWIIHGRYDVVCPVKNAWDLAKAFPEARLNIVPDAGHAFDEPGILAALLSATEEFKAIANPSA